MKVINIASQETREDPDKNGYFKIVHLPFTTEQLEVLQRHAEDLIAKEKAEAQRKKHQAAMRARPWWKKAYEFVDNASGYVIGAAVLFVVGGFAWAGIQYVVNQALATLRALIIWWAMSP